MSRAAALGFGCTFLAGVSLVAANRLAQVESHPAEPHEHPAAQSIKSPSPSSPETLAAGRRLYTRFCANCHGPKGKGDGGGATGGGQPSDLTDRAWQHGFTEGEVFVVIRDGTSPDMEPWKERLSEEEIWKIVHFVRSLAPPEEKKF